MAYSAHLGGFMLGITLGVAVLKVQMPSWCFNVLGMKSTFTRQTMAMTRFKLKLKWIGLAIAVIGFTFALFWNIFKSHTYYLPHYCT